MRTRRRIVGILLILPALLFFGVFFVAPMALTVWMSLHSWPVLGTPEFVGLRNYQRMPDNRDFITALGFTIQFALIITPLLFGVGLLLALLLQSTRRIIVLARTAVFLPVSLGFAAASYLWLALLNQRVGLANKALVDVGVLPKPIDWFIDPFIAMLVVVVVTLWKLSGFSMIAFINGLNSIPVELEEAAKIDGAGALRTFLSIKLPLLRPTVAFVITFLAIGALLTFDQFYVLTAGGPQNRTITAVYRIYNTSFLRGDLGLGAAMSIVFLMVVLAITAAQLYLLNRRSGV
jgi:multiple sugar transport system permease protein